LRRAQVFLRADGDSVWPSHSKQSAFKVTEQMCESERET